MIDYRWTKTEMTLRSTLRWFSDATFWDTVYCVTIYRRSR